MVGFTDDLRHHHRRPRLSVRPQERRHRRHHPRALNQLQLHSSPYQRGRALQGLDRHIAVLRIEHAVDLCTARAHCRGQAGLGYLAVAHRLGELPVDDFLDRPFLKFAEHVLAVEKLSSVEPRWVCDLQFRLSISL